MLSSGFTLDVWRYDKRQVIKKYFYFLWTGSYIKIIYTHSYWLTDSKNYSYTNMFRTFLNAGDTILNHGTSLDIKIFRVLSSYVCVLQEEKQYNPCKERWLNYGAYHKWMKNKDEGELPRQSSGEDSTLPTRGPQVWLLAEKLRSHMLCSAAKNHHHHHKEECAAFLLMARHSIFCSKFIITV